MRKPFVKPVSAEDLKARGILDACKKAVVDALRPSLAENRDRYLRELRLQDVEAVAVGVVSAYISARLEAETLNDDISNVGVA